MAFRAFVGVPIDPSPPLVELLELLHAAGPDIKPVSPEHLHLTLSFLGDVPDDSTLVLSEALDKAVHEQPAFDLELHGVGAFPNVRHPRVVWAGCLKPAQVSTLANRARASLAAAGFAGDEREFRAHLTLARVKGDRGVDKVITLLRDHGRDVLPVVPVEDVVLFRSVLGPEGPAYERLHVSRLEARA